MAGPRGPGRILGFEGIEFKHYPWPCWSCMNSLKPIKNHIWSKNKKNHAPHRAVLGLTNKIDHKALDQIEPKGLGLYTTLTIVLCPQLAPSNWKTLTTDLRAQRWKKSWLWVSKANLSPWKKCQRFTAQIQLILWKKSFPDWRMAGNENENYNKPSALWLIESLLYTRQALCWVLYFHYLFTHHNSSTSWVYLHLFYKRECNSK